MILDRLMHYLRNTTLSLIALCAVALLLGWFMPVVPTELQAWEADDLGQQEQCTVLFVGPSYVKQVDPGAFNAETKRLGTRDRACKLGRTNLAGVELEHELDVLLRGDWPKLKLVVIDITIGDHLEFKQENWFKRRVIDWHTPSSVSKLPRYYAHSKKPWRDKLNFSWAHLEHLAVNMLGVGRGSELLGLVEGFRGDSERPRRKINKPRRYRHVLSALKQARRKLDAKPRYASSRWPSSLRSKVRSHGFEAAFLIAPVLNTVRLPEGSALGKDRLMVMNFNDPERYPELYTLKARGNTGHIHHSAFKAYSKRLAQAVAKLQVRKP